MPFGKYVAVLAAAGARYLATGGKWTERVPGALVSAWFTNSYVCMNV